MFLQLTQEQTDDLIAVGCHNEVRCADRREAPVPLFLQGIHGMRRLRLDHDLYYKVGFSDKSKLVLKLG